MGGKELMLCQGVAGRGRDSGDQEEGGGKSEECGGEEEELECTEVEGGYLESPVCEEVQEGAGGEDTQSAGEAAEAAGYGDVHGTMLGGG